MHLAERTELDFQSQIVSSRKKLLPSPIILFLLWGVLIWRYLIELNPQKHTGLLSRKSKFFSKEIENLTEKNSETKPYLAYTLTNCIFNWKTSEVKIYIFFKSDGVLCQNKQPLFCVCDGWI